VHFIGMTGRGQLFTMSYFQHQFIFRTLFAVAVVRMTCKNLIDFEYLFMCGIAMVHEHPAVYVISMI